MTLVIRASPSPTSLYIPSIKQDDLQRHKEGPLTSPLQNLFPFNGLPSLPLPSNLFLSLFVHPLHATLSSSTGQSVKVAKCYRPNKMVKGPKEQATLAEGEDVASDWRGWTGRCGFSLAPTWLLLGGKKLIK